ncbi:MAG: succinate-semialdehyde dehydrogenase/glutarate-semialdehyde dehydrogenase, partial [Verrucomicrobiales bacterium]
MQTQLVINGERRAGSDGQTVDVLNPANGTVIATVECGSVADMEAACDAAAAAQKLWAKVAPRERAEMLRACFEVMMANQDRLADLIVAEHGKAKS